MPIPRGYVRCEVCGKFNGSTRARNLHWSGYVRKPNEIISVTCLCEGVLCRTCEKNKIQRPITNAYNEADNSVWHAPWCFAMMPCRECSEKSASLQTPDPESEATSP